MTILTDTAGATCAATHETEGREPLPTATPRQLLRAWLARELPDAAMAWLDDAAADTAQGASCEAIELDFLRAPRKLGKAPLALSTQDLAAAQRARPGWNPQGLCAAAAGRLLLLLSVPGPGRLAELVDRFCATGDVAAQVACLRGLPLYPEPCLHIDRAREAARSNMRLVFDALAHDNPYPAEQFDPLAWNHLVLKALFVGSRLSPIVGLDARANPELARMLCDYAHERWAAGRPVSPELWRCVGVHGGVDAVADRVRVLQQGNDIERSAAARALADSRLPAARAALVAHAPELLTAIDAGRIAWGDVVPSP